MDDLLSEELTCAQGGGWRGGGGGGVKKPVPIVSNPGTVSDLVTCIASYVTRAKRGGDGKPTPRALDEIQSDIENPKVQSFHGIISRIPGNISRMVLFWKRCKHSPQKEEAFRKQLPKFLNHFRKYNIIILAY